MLEGVVVGFQIFAWAPNFLGFFSFLKEILEGGQLEFSNFTGGLFLQKKRDINPPLNLKTPLASWGAFFFVFFKTIYSKY
jgi:hypothetical protein